jgi:hypothetical protein
MAGKCVVCGKYVCSQCAVLTGDKIYCAQHAPKTGCFIATAAYGTPMAEEINALRRFRDDQMEPNTLGRHLVLLYYEVSPPIARVLARSESMRAFVRLNLKPIVRSLESKNKKQNT